MADITESNTWEAVRQWEITDPAIGGTNGVMNTPLKSLVNRSAYLKNLVETIISGATGLVGKLLNGSTCENVFTAQQNDTKVATTAFVQAAVAAVSGGRNMILNGDMEIAQRGTSFNLTTDGPHWTLDRWLIELAGRDVELGQDPDIHRSDIPNVAHSMKVKLKIGTGSIAIKQRIESVWTFAGGKCVVHLAIHAPVEFDITVRVSQFLSATELAGTAHWNDAEVVRCTVGYNRYAVVFDIPDIADVVHASFDEQNCLELSIETTDTRDVDFWLTQVKVESGSIPTAFEDRNDFNECLRFYEQNTYHERHDEALASGGTPGTSYWYVRQHFTPKRIIPDITMYDVVYTGLNTVSSLSNIETNGATLAIQPVDVSAGTYMHREIEFDMLINAEIE